MVPFAGWEMPVSYKGIISEHESVRDNCGIFDVGHMGIIDITPNFQIQTSNKLPNSNFKAQIDTVLSFIMKMATNNAFLLSENECQYSILCNESGGTIDDILVYRLKDRIRIVANASNTDNVLAWFQARSTADIGIEHRTDLCMISLQGPKAKAFFPEACQLKHNHCILWNTVLVSRTGYTGEDGFEFFAPKDSVAALWQKFISAGACPCGLGARDTLRLEAGLPLYGHEYNDETSPIEAGYSWAVKFDHEFIGKDALLAQKNLGLKKKLVGLKFKDKAIPRQGIEVFSSSEIIGIVTSGTFSPTLKIPVALAYLSPSYATPGGEVQVVIRNNPFPAVVTAKKMI